MSAKGDGRPNRKNVVKDLSGGFSLSRLDPWSSGFRGGFLKKVSTETLPSSSWARPSPRLRAGPAHPPALAHAGPRPGPAARADEARAPHGRRASRPGPAVHLRRAQAARQTGGRAARPAGDARRPTLDARRSTPTRPKEKRRSDLPPEKKKKKEKRAHTYTHARFIEIDPLLFTRDRRPPLGIPPSPPPTPTRPSVRPARADVLLFNGGKVDKAGNISSSLSRSPPTSVGKEKTGPQSRSSPPCALDPLPNPGPAPRIPQRLSARWEVRYLDRDPFFLDPHWVAGRGVVSLVPVQSSGAPDPPTEVSVPVLRCEGRSWSVKVGPCPYRPSLSPRRQTLGLKSRTGP